jgi:hypothetical protein
MRTLCLLLSLVPYTTLGNSNPDLRMLKAKTQKGMLKQFQFAMRPLGLESNEVSNWWNLGDSNPDLFNATPALTGQRCQALIGLWGSRTRTGALTCGFVRDHRASDLTLITGLVFGGW